jgi:hypothetical protein
LARLLVISQSPADDQHAAADLGAIGSVCRDSVLNPANQAERSELVAGTKPGSFSRRQRSAGRRIDAAKFAAKR